MIRELILSLSCVKAEIQRFKDEERPKIFALAQKDLLESFREDVEERAEELAKEKLGKLLSVVDMNSVVMVDNNKRAVIGKDVVDAARASNLKAEADFMMQSELWKLLNETPKQLAQQAMFVNGETMESLVKGRSMLYVLSTQQHIIDIFKNYQPKAPLLDKK